ncbi:MAG: hypothetical protein ABIG71_04240 [Candidatus Uhrbacteria bacterium]
MGLSNRQLAILFEVIVEYVQTAEPVSSAAIGRRGIDASPATIRSELVALEHDGYLVQPHTSAGRVPTPAAYERYVEYVQQQEQRLREARVAAFVQLMREVCADIHFAGRALARAVASEAGQAVVVGISSDDTYGTGLTYVVQQPEFQDPVVLREFSIGFDDLPTSIAQVRGQLQRKTDVILGTDNPFGDQCGVVAGELMLPEGSRVTIGIVGPMRMAYDQQLGLIHEVQAACREVS